MRTRRSPKIFIVRFLLLVSCLSTGLFFSANAQSTSGGQPGEAGQTPNQQQNVTQEIPTDGQTVAHGRELFSQHCTACHQIKQQLIGPALASVHQTRPLPWLLKFIKNSQNVILNEKDEYAVQLFQQYKQQVMPQFEFLSNDDIVSILAYIKAESTASTAVGGVNGASSANNPDAIQSDNGADEAYSQKDDNERGEGDVSSGLPGSLTFGLVAGMLLLIGVIFAVARKSGKPRHNKAE